MYSCLQSGRSHVNVRQGFAKYVSRDAAIELLLTSKLEIALVPAASAEPQAPTALDSVHVSTTHDS